MVGFLRILVFLGAQFVAASVAWARPPFDPSQLPRAPLHPLEEKFHPLAAAKIVVTDPDLFREDFKEVGHLARMQDVEVSAVLLRSGAVTSIPQARQTVTNSSIPIVADRVVPGLRPAAYGRAAFLPLLVPVGDGPVFYIDCKGCGGLSPQNKSHSNGLLTLADALREYLISKVVNLILQAEGYGPGVLPTYGVVDAGFDVTYKGAPSEPAGLLFRRAAHRARPDGYTDPARSRQVEGILRKYGLTSDWSNTGREFQLLEDNNLQTTREGAVFDFQDFLVVDRFSNSPVEADPEFRLPVERWGAAPGDPSGRDRVHVWCGKVARSWRAGVLTPAQIEQMIEKEWIDPVREMLKRKHCQAPLMKKGVG